MPLKGHNTIVLNWKDNGYIYKTRKGVACEEVYSYFGSDLLSDDRINKSDEYSISRYMDIFIPGFALDCMNFLIFVGKVYRQYLWKNSLIPCYKQFVVNHLYTQIHC